jgi:hypothetical protein
MPRRILVFCIYFLWQKWHSNMAEQYYFSRGEIQKGPYTADEMRDLARAGQIQPSDLVWQQGMKQRFPASSVQELFEDPPDEADAVAPGSVEADLAALEPEAAPEKVAADYSVPASEKPVRPPEKERPRRVVAIKGGVIVSQDGKYVQYRKKCTVCGYEEQGKANQLIRPGSMKIPFFCRKCRKGRSTEMQGIS